MCDDQTLQVLKDIDATLNSDQYEVSDPFTIGGATGAYYIRSPWNTECEWSMVSAFAAGTLASTATYAVGSKNPTQPSLSTTGGDSFGKVSTSGTDTVNAVPSYVGALTSQAPFVTYGGDNYMPLANPPIVYLQTTTPASSEVLITIQFRRKLNRSLPDKPRQRPHTHTHPQSRRPLRQLTAQSTQVAGFESQYPEPGGAPYQHQNLPAQDTAVARHGVFPLGPGKLGPTNVKHTKGRDGNGRR